MAALTLLNAVTSTGAGPIRDIGHVIKDHVFSASITGAPSAVTVALEGSIDGTNFAAIDSHVFSAGELTATFALVTLVDLPVTFVRANLTTLTGGTAPTVTFLYEGDNNTLNKRNRRGAF